VGSAVYQASLEGERRSFSTRILQNVPSGRNWPPRPKLGTPPRGASVTPPAVIGRPCESVPVPLTVASRVDSMAMLISLIVCAKLTVILCADVASAVPG
jgi:hypothetical protein